MKRFFVVIAACFWIPVASAHAQSWIATVKEDDFGSNHVGVAMIQTNGRGFGLRCSKGNDPAIVFLTREQWGDGLSAIPAKLLIKIDDSDATSHDAELEPYDGGNAFRQLEAVKATATGDELIGLISNIKKARKRIAVAIEIAGQRFENTRFPSSGSTKALAKILHTVSS